MLTFLATLVTLVFLNSTNTIYEIELKYESIINNRLTLLHDEKNNLTVIASDVNNAITNLVIVDADFDIDDLIGMNIKEINEHPHCSFLEVNELQDNRKYSISVSIRETGELTAIALFDKSGTITRIDHTKNVLIFQGTDDLRQKIIENME